jgi:hypothetical protein
MSGGQYSFQKITQYSQGHIMLGHLANNIDSLITRDTVLPPFTRRGPFCRKMMFLTTENPEI